VLVGTTSSVAGDRAGLYLAAGVGMSAVICWLLAVLTTSAIAALSEAAKRTFRAIDTARLFIVPSSKSGYVSNND